MVRDASPVVGARKLVEPPQAEGRQQLALAGDAGGEHVVERADPVARDDQHALGEAPSAASSGTYRSRTLPE